MTKKNEVINGYAFGHINYSGIEEQHHFKTFQEAVGYGLIHGSNKNILTNIFSTKCKTCLTCNNNLIGVEDRMCFVCEDKFLNIADDWEDRRED